MVSRYDSWFCQQIALKGVHYDTGHQGKEMTKQRFHWPGLEKDVNRIVEQCGRCIRRKTPIRPTASFVPIETTRPMQLVVLIS